MDTYHKQCKLQKQVQSGFKTTTAWLPEQFAKLNHWVILKQDDSWEAGWQVIEVGTRLATKYMLERSTDYKHTREASDV